MKWLDCLGDICPVPIMKLQRELGSMESGEHVMLVTDHSCTLSSTREFCAIYGLRLEAAEALPGVWEIEITKA
ncbi:hypothetical protein SDC9_88503 [bioreactor metagenome]|uniref:UPF0033 domain-containing protein n=1 Tax=bioreactor metagenome TaxID=1076179 RepID=A0A644ZT70_9ZZZZ